MFRKQLMLEMLDLHWRCAGCGAAQHLNRTAAAAGDTLALVVWPLNGPSMCRLWRSEGILARDPTHLLLHLYGMLVSGCTTHLQP